MPKHRNLDEQFKNPIAYWEDGNSYCRIREFWDSLSCTTFSSLEELEESERQREAARQVELATYPTYAFSIPPLPPASEQIVNKTGTWSGTEKRHLETMTRLGLDLDEITKRLKRTEGGVINMAKKMCLCIMKKAV